MSGKFKQLLCCVLFLCLLPFINAFAEIDGYRVRELIPEKVISVEDTATGDQQLVLVSEKGLVVLNSFWSETTARRFKAAIVDALGRNDFVCLINTVDRLDSFGGNAAYNGIRIIGHKAILDKYEGKEAAAEAEVKQLIEMWKHKDSLSRERLSKLEPGSEQAIMEQKWSNTCKTRADELDSGFSLVLPTETFEDRKTLSLGDLTLNLIWFGKSDYDGLTVITIPQLSLALVPGFILHSQHLAPFPFPVPAFARIDVPRWIQVLQDMLEGDTPVDQVLCGMDYSEQWSRERALTRLHYIRQLWNSVAELESAGVDLPELYDTLSLEKEFAFVKEWKSYKDFGDDWFRPQHNMHIRLFFLQHKNPASAIIQSMGPDSLSEALAKVRKLRDQGVDIYFEEAALNAIGYGFLFSGEATKAAEVLKLNVEVFPESANAYDSYAEALMKSGDKDNAILNYKKSLELNPENENAKKMLLELSKS